MTHNYLSKILELAKHAEKGGLLEIDVRHDKWCEIYKNKACNCNPEVKVRNSN